jgi:uncharacterized protein YoxC
MKKLFTLFLLGAFTLAVVACDNKSEKEEAKDQIEESTEEMGDAVEDAVEEVDDATEEVTEEVEENVEEATEEVEEVKTIEKKKKKN